MDRRIELISSEPWPEIGVDREWGRIPHRWESEGSLSLARLGVKKPTGGAVTQQWVNLLFAWHRFS